MSTESQAHFPTPCAAGQRLHPELVVESIKKIVVRKRRTRRNNHAEQDNIGHSYASKDWQVGAAPSAALMGKSKHGQPAMLQTLQ